MSPSDDSPLLRSLVVLLVMVVAVDGDEAVGDASARLLDASESSGGGSKSCCLPSRRSGCNCAR